MSADLTIAALDGGAALILTRGDSVIELRMGWQAARRVTHAIELATRLSPPWEVVRTTEGLGPSGGWIGDQLEVFDQPVREDPCGARDDVNAIFVRLTRSDADLATSENLPRAIFASDAQPDGRPADCHAVIWGRDGERIAAHQAVEARGGGTDGAIGGAPEVVVAAVAVVRDLDGQATVHGNRPEDVDPSTKRDGSGAGPAGAAGRRPADVDVDPTEVREGEGRHDGAEDAESAFVETGIAPAQAAAQ